MGEFEPICELGRAVIQTEASALQTLAARLDERFATACHILVNCKGRIIVMGVGKSGHISKKIAATFASTGTPAFFVHPGEAKHGDIGMITTNDVIVVLSNSGETEEILFIIPVIKKLNIPWIALTGKPNSTLAKEADINLDVSIDKEACPLGLAPTSSTTAALAMGDALAITLLQMRGFTTDDFAMSHPGGILGRRLLLKIDTIMHSGSALPKITDDALLKTALIEMTSKKLGMTTIVNKHDKLVGVFTDGDLRRLLDASIDIHKVVIHEVIHNLPKVIQPGMLVVEALDLMRKYKITSLVVTDDAARPLGIVHMHDILQLGIV